MEETALINTECLWRPNSGCEHRDAVVVSFSSGDNDVKDKLCFRQPCTAVTRQNEECLSQLIHIGQWMTTCVELKIGFGVSEAMVTILEYHKVCTRWVPQKLKQEQKGHCMHVCQDLLN